MYYITIKFDYELQLEASKKVILFMTKLLVSLKKGLQALRNQIQSHQGKINAKWKAGQDLTESDEEWLDGGGNLVDEEHVVDILDKASDYERGLGQMNEKDKTVVWKLQILGGGINSEWHGYADLCG